MNHQTISNKNHVYKMAVLISYFFLKAFLGCIKGSGIPLHVYIGKSRNAFGFIKSDGLDGFGIQLIKKLIQVSHPYRIRVSDLALMPLSQQGINPYLLFQAGENEFSKC